MLGHKHGEPGNAAAVASFGGNRVLNLARGAIARFRFARPCIAR